MKKTPTIGILLSFLTLLLVGCLVDDPDVSDDDLASLSGGKTPTGPAADVGGGECLPEEAERGSCNGGGGGTGGPTGDQCTPGEPGCETCTPGQQGCPGPVRPRPPCVAPSPDHVCTYYPSGGCYCVYNPPPFAPTATDDAGVSTLSVGAPTEGIITDWCSDHPWDARCSDQGGSGGGGGGGGSGGGNCIPGDIGCHGPVNCSIGFRWNNVTRRCEYQNVGEDCSFDPGDRCIRDITGYCQCLFPEGPLFTEPVDD
jgi:hypothetical protein